MYPRTLRARGTLGNTLDEAEVGNNRPFAVGDEVDLGGAEVAVDLAHHVIEDIEELAAVVLELRDDLDVIEIVVEQVGQVEFEQPGLIGEESEPVGDVDPLDQLFEKLLQSLVVVACPLVDQGAFSTETETLNQRSGPLARLFQGVLVSDGSAGDVGPVDLGKPAIDRRVAVGLGDEDADRAPRSVEPTEWQSGRHANVVANPVGDGLHRLTLELVADPVDRDEDLADRVQRSISVNRGVWVCSGSPLSVWPSASLIAPNSR